MPSVKYTRKAFETAIAIYIDSLDQGPARHALAAMGSFASFTGCSDFVDAMVSVAESSHGAAAHVVVAFGDAHQWKVRFVHAIINRLHAVGLIDFPLRGILDRSAVTDARRQPSRLDVDTLLSHVDTMAAMGDTHSTREAALFRFMGAMGMRRTTVAKLTVAGLGDLLMPVRTGDAVRRWMHVRRQDSNPHLFHRTDRQAYEFKPLSGESMRFSLASKCAEAGVDPIVPDGLSKAGRCAVAAGFSDEV